MLRLTVLYTVLCGPADVRQRVAMYSEPVDAGVGRVAMVTLNPQLNYVVSDRVLDSADVGRLRVLYREVLYGRAIGVVLIVSEQMRVGVHLAVQTLQIYCLNKFHHNI